MSFANLRSVLANLYPDEISTRRIIDDAGIESSYIRLNATAIDNWHNILSEAERIGQVEALLGVVAREYGGNWEFRNACDAYRRNHPLGLRLKTYSKSAPTSGNPPSIPELLPYMPDRSEQEHTLREMWRQTGPQCCAPIVFVVYGDNLQCHDMFLKRLRRITLPGLLNLPLDSDTVSAYSLDWPKNPQNDQEFHNKIQMDLARKICQYDMESIEEINHRLSRHPSPVLVHAHLWIENWQRHDANAVINFLRFWHQWPPLAPQQRLV